MGSIDMMDTDSSYTGKQPTILSLQAVVSAVKETGRPEKVGGVGSLS